MWIVVSSSILLGFSLGIGAWDLMWSRSMPPRIKEMVRDWEEDCRPRMLIGISIAEHRESFNRRWGLKDSNPRMFPITRQIFGDRIGRSGGKRRHRKSRNDSQAGDRSD